MGRRRVARRTQEELGQMLSLLSEQLGSARLIKTFRLELWQPTPLGQEKQHYTVELTNANISAIQAKMANNRHPKLMKLPEYEEISFTYQKICWTWTDGGISAEDDWETPR